MNSKIALLALLFALPLVSAECKSFVKNGYPLGIIPNATNLTILQTTLNAQNTSFGVYIEGDASTGDLGGCRVGVTVEGVQEGSQVTVYPPIIETGLGWGQVVVNVETLPIAPYTASEGRLRLEDMDNKATVVRIPFTITPKFKVPTATPVVTAVPTANVTATPTVKVSATAESLPDTLKDVGKSLEQDATKYIVAVLAFFFLAALLYVGFKTLQKD